MARNIDSPVENFKLQDKVAFFFFFFLPFIGIMLY